MQATATPSSRTTRNYRIKDSVYALLHPESGLYFAVSGPRARLVDLSRASLYPATQAGLDRAHTDAALALPATAHEVQRLDAARGCA